MRSSLLSLLALCACAAHQPGFYSAYGVAHYGNVSQEKVDRLEKQLIVTLTVQRGWGMRRMEEVMPYIETRWSGGPVHQGENWRGMADGSRIVIANDEECRSQSAYRHELTHVLASWIAARPDRDHKDTSLWRLVDSIPCIDSK